MMTSKAQIVATIGPASRDRNILRSMFEHQVDVVRLNFSWSNFEERTQEIVLIKELAHEIGRRIPIIQDVPGPRIQNEQGHTLDHRAVSAFTDHDRELVAFGIEKGVDYIAVSFVSGPEDIDKCRAAIKECGGNQKVIAKIERKGAVESFDAILAVADAVMIARGDLGNEIPIEQVPFVQEDIIKKCNAAKKPVITATQMLLSMVNEKSPTRAEVTDVTNAILQGSDAVMLSEETARGSYPLEAVTVMERIVVEAEKHRGGRAVNPL
jgi:pyruvate kinase